MTDAAANASGSPMPLFYEKPAVVSPERHKDWKIKQKRSYAYAARAHAVPVVLDEVPLLEGYFPLVFTPGDNPAMVALTGLRPDESLMVQKDGSWRPGFPVPAYITRYPFILVQVPNDTRMILVMEEDANVVGPDGDLPLFDAEGKGTQNGQEVLNYCGAFNRSVEITQAFCRELQERGLLVDQRADLVAPDGQRISLSGFRVIDEQKFNALPDDVFVEWRKRNWVGIVYAHLMSLGRWSRLLELTAGKTA